MASDELEIRLAWERHLGRGSAASTWLDTVLARHREPHRHYHDLRHVAWMLRHLDDLGAAGRIDDMGAVVAAACFHDAVYDPRAGHGENERASASLARTALAELEWDAARIDHVAEMIVATIDHDVSATDDADTLAVLAADLAVLAAEPAPYGDYVRAVRREYAHVDDDGWRTGRAAVLRQLLGRDRLFATSLELDAWERRARANLTAELSSLER